MEWLDAVTQYIDIDSDVAWCTAGRTALLPCLVIFSFADKVTAKWGSSFL